MKSTLTKKKTLTKRVIKEKSFPVVAIGASAGGLNAAIELLKNLAPDTGMAFIYVQHLSPDHKGMLTAILSKVTKMKVQEIDDMDTIKPNNVFVIPSNRGIEVTDGHIKLIPRSENNTAITIDVLFTSLAQAQKERVIGIILSGNGSDGTRGMRDIKYEGGLTFAQNDTAKFASMPRSAIDAGVVDFILTPKEIALELVRLSKHSFVEKSQLKTGEEDLIENDNPDLKNILSQLHKATQVDFSVYKMTTIKRRIIRRMLLYKIKTLKSYSTLLAKKKEEVDILYQDLLINVTSFFRDTDTHKYLKENLFPGMLKRKKAGESLRIWVPACASGEEAYSIAMILLEIQDNKTLKIPVQIFATDLSMQAIAKARVGVYSKQDLETVSPKRIQRFFTKSDGGYRINKSIRDICVFAPHNILYDPPFSRLDFISCCNLFIYFDISAQKKAIATFHYALNHNGFLMLGKSETISASASLFTVVNKKYKIFLRKKNAGSRVLPELSPRGMVPVVTGNKLQIKKLVAETSGNGRSYVDSAIDNVLLSDFMPASVVINHQMEIVQFRGSTDFYLSHPKGKATFNVLKMVKPEIAFELRNAISKTMKTNQRVRKSGMEIKANAGVRIVSVEVVPLKVEADEPFLLILFTDQEKIESFSLTNKKGKGKSVVVDRRIKKLEEELTAAHAEAFAFAQEQELFTEELQSAHEEVVSSNEELQTVNEELETSKEEIESANEELITTNQELQTRNDLLSESYEYSEAIISTIHEAMVVLDKNFCIKSANKSFYKKFDIREEVAEGMSLFELGNKQWDTPKLRALLLNIIPKNSNFQDYELTLGEKTIILNANRVVQKAHREQLILISIADITEVRKLLLEKESQEKELQKREIKRQQAQSVLLEEIVEKRTKDLVQANHRLETMNKELEAFTFISSHDLQEPLRKIQTLAGRILETENDNLSYNGKEFFHSMQNAAERMRQLILDLLIFSRLSEPNRVFELVGLHNIIKQVTNDLKELIVEKNAVVELKEMCDVRVIPFQFRQLVYNLLSNALKFSNPEIAPHIIITGRNIKYDEISVANLLPEKEYSCITVSDNGIGFENKFSEKIFELFQRLHSQDEYEGTGIGLAIVKKIVENHNGAIVAESKVNKGATFEIYIPA